MKELAVAFCALFVLGGVVLSTPLSTNHGKALLGRRQCTYGPSFWCHNITNAKGCGAVQHCIQTVWEMHDVPEDNDSICQICLDMVKQARDQLESNQTQDDIREVFEGSCKLIPLKPFQKECIKLADNFIPELIEALASQMNPQVVCSVAGLCNNAAIDKMLSEIESMPAEVINTNTKPTEKTESVPYEIEESTAKPNILTCENCNEVATIIANKFHSANRDDILENLLSLCGKTSSFSDACANIILTYFNELYDAVKSTLDPESICHMSGTCASKYHQHPEKSVEIHLLSGVGVVPVGDDVPCKLCEQLVKHLSEVLIANTTEAEFKTVLQGLCKQTKGFQQECLSIVDQYYDVIYQALVNNLDPNGICFLIGICQKGISDTVDSSPSMVLLPTLKPQRINVTITKKNGERKLLGVHEPKYTQKEIIDMQLPIDKLMGAQNSFALIENGQLCTLCEYVLHFAQEALSMPSNEDKIKEAVEHVCDKFPTTIKGECHDFIVVYGDAIIALLVQSIDPIEICPMLKFCPKAVQDMEVFAPQPIEVSINAKPINNDKPTCPLCLFAVMQLQQMIESNKTKENVKHALENLCTRLPKKMQLECTDFVETYASQLIEKLINDFTPQDICESLQLCSNKQHDVIGLRVHFDNDAESSSSESLTDNIDKDKTDETNEKSIYCKKCQKVAASILKRIVNKQSNEQILYALSHACDSVGIIYKNKCRKYISTHKSIIVEYIKSGMSAKQICNHLGACFTEHEEFHHPPPPPPPLCKLCQKFFESILKLVTNKNKEEIEHAIEEECNRTTPAFRKQCKMIMTKYADKVIESILKGVPIKDICILTNFCFAVEHEDEIYPSKPKPSICKMCQHFFYSILKKTANKTRDEIKDILIAECNHTSPVFRKKCKLIISKFADIVIDALLKKTAPKLICKEIHMCLKEGENVEDMDIDEALSVSVVAIPTGSVVDHTAGIDDITPISKDDTPCVICEFVMTKIEQELKNKKTDDEIKKAVHNICNKMPKTISASCIKFVDQYGDLIINLIKTVPPHKICQQIHLCQQLSYQITDEVIECGICHGAVVALADILKDPEVDHDLENLVQKSCNILPGKYYEKCSKLIQYYGESIINLVTSGNDLSKICAKIGMCFNTENSSLAFVQIREQEAIETS